MCIRDRCFKDAVKGNAQFHHAQVGAQMAAGEGKGVDEGCLLYTSEKDMVVKAQSGEFSQVQILLFMVRLVEQEDDGNVRLAEVVRNALVNGSEVVPAVQHEEEIGRAHV